MAVLLLLILVATPVLAGEITSQHYHIVPDSSTDLCQHYQAGSCLTLDQLSSQLSQTGDITLSFLPGYHLLTWDLSISGANNVTFSSENFRLSPSRITCLQNVGILVHDTNLFTLQGLEIRGCRTQGVAPIWLDATVANILHCLFTNNTVVDGSGGAVSIAGGHAFIDSCTFQFNKAMKLALNSTGSLNGGALELKVNLTTITNTIFINNSAERFGGALHGWNLQLTVTRCHFINNTATLGGSILVSGKSMLYSSLNGYVHNRAAEEGGAVCSLVPTVFDSDSFHDNKAKRGSAAHLRQNTTLTNCSFIENGRGEGVVYLDQTVAKFVKFNSFTRNDASLYVFYSQVWFSDCTLFQNNTSKSGGAIISISSTITFQPSSETVINGNIARKGGGVYLKQSVLIVYGDIFITGNKARLAGGGIHAFRSIIQFGINSLHTGSFDASVNNVISYNTAKKYGGGLQLSDTEVIISNRLVSVVGNTAKLYGGGMFLEPTSIVSMKSNYEEVYLNLTSNSALKGGGIYIADGGNGALCESVKQQSSCFLKTIVSDNPTKFGSKPSIVFGDNRATETGSDMYGGLLDRCRVMLSFTAKTVTENNMNGLLLLQSVVGFGWADSKQHGNDSWKSYGRALNVHELYHHISSDPVRVCLCESDVIDCNSKHPTVYKKKGERFTLSLVAMDQVGKPVSATLRSSLTSDSGRLKEGQQSRRIGNQCSQLEYNAYSSSATEDIEFYANGPCKYLGISKAIVNIVFLPCTCPVGLERVPPDNDCSCDCDKRLIPFVSSCSVERGTILINSNVWIKHINSTNATDYIIHDCPFDYCVTKPINVSLIDQDEQCAFNRSGTLCGECEQGLSLVFASSQCQQCSNYYLFLLLPFALAGVALVAFILVLNMTVAKGTIHGLIFYANILAANQSIFLPFDFPNFLTVFISWLNLDLGIETCFYNRMDSYGKLMLQLVFPAYVFVLIAMIMVLCDRSQKIARLFGKKNPEATLYTLILLSYSKLIRLIITALQFTTISYPDGTKETVWLYDANVPYFTASHIPRFIAAVIITLVGSVYITLLLFGQLFNRCSGYRFMKWTTHKYYIHFLKAHHAPFSDKHRYWVGLLLLVRLAHYLISTFLSHSVVVLSASLSAFSVILWKQLSGKIYVTRWLDSLESLFLANLTVLGVSTLYSNGNQQALALISMSVTFIAFLALVLYHMLLLFGIRFCKVPKEAIATFSRYGHHHQVQAERKEEDRLKRSEEPLYELKDLQNYTDNSKAHLEPYIPPPIIRSAVPDDQLREPALDDLCPVRPEDYVQHDVVRAPQQQFRQTVTFAEIAICNLGYST